MKNFQSEIIRISRPISQHGEIPIKPTRRARKQHERDRLRAAKANAQK
jgi:hypothetical protein